MFDILKEIQSVRSVKWGEAALRENTRHRSPATKSNLHLTALQIYYKYIANILQLYQKCISNIFFVFIYVYSNLPLNHMHFTLFAAFLT